MPLLKIAETPSPSPALQTRGVDLCLEVCLTLLSMTWARAESSAQHPLNSEAAMKEVWPSEQEQASPDLTTDFGGGIIGSLGMDPGSVPLY